MSWDHLPLRRAELRDMNRWDERPMSARTWERSRTALGLWDQRREGRWRQWSRFWSERRTPWERHRLRQWWPLRLTRSSTRIARRQCPTGRTRRSWRSSERCSCEGSADAFRHNRPALSSSRRPPHWTDRTDMLAHCWWSDTDCYCQWHKTLLEAHYSWYASTMQSAYLDHLISFWMSNLIMVSL